jgi:hypothetical protein
MDKKTRAFMIAFSILGLISVLTIVHRYVVKENFQVYTDEELFYEALNTESE